MKKKNACLLIAIASLSLVACSSNPSSTSDTSSGSKDDGTITVDPNLEGLTDFNSQYSPVKDSIQKRSGSIKVCLDFQGTEDAWNELGKEYSRLHGGQVVVKISKATGTYSDYISNQRNSLDIVQGNYVENIETKCIDLSSEIKKDNAYCGYDSSNKINKWKNVLDKAAYETESSESNNVYILNSENLQTCFFVNKVAIEEARSKGYEGGDNPSSWDELIDLCKYMKEAGYKYPLGISLETESINYNQFTWLLRVYGDYYYRNLYDKQSNRGILNNDEFTYDPTDPYPERDDFCKYEFSTLYNSILDSRPDSEKTGMVFPKYVGPQSGRFKEFASQLYKMRGYLPENPVADSQETLRSRFYSQANKDAPQIMLDYLGQGLLFLKNEQEGKFVTDFFDYPAMNASEEYSTKGSIVRDVGGNGGYLSIYDNGSEQNALCADFLKFVLSPYGQSIYYKALSTDDFAPNGITTVNKNLVSIPDKWKTFFNNEKIVFNGLVDANPYVKNFLRGFASETSAKNSLREQWRTYLFTDSIGESSESIEENKESRTETFASSFDSSCIKAWGEYCDTNGFNKNSYLTPGSSL